MYKHILNTILSVFLTYCSLTAQNNTWTARVQTLDNVPEPNEQICDAVSNGQLRIPPNLSQTPNYDTYFKFNDSICISRNFSLEVRVRNNATLGGQGAFDAEVGFFSNGFNTSARFAGAVSGQSATRLQLADSILATNQAWLVTNLTDWRVIRMTFFNDTMRLFLDGSRLYTSAHSRKVCNIDILYFKLRGSGAVDWVKVFDNENNLVYNEDFTDCQRFSSGIKCDPSVPLSLSIRKPCEGDTMSLCANFPAMSYDWGGPNNVRSTSKCLIIPNASKQNNAGIYSLSANINKCFAYFKQFNTEIFRNTTAARTIDLCFGQTFTLPSGRVINASGTFTETIPTVNGCDSVITFTIRIGTSAKDSFVVQRCAGQCYEFASGKRACTTGIFRDTVSEASGCKREIIVNLTTLNAFTSNTDATICQGQTYRLPLGRVVSTEGVYRDTLKASGGCDSIVVTNLKISLPPTVVIAGATAETQEGNPVRLSVSSASGNKYEWFVNSDRTNDTSNTKPLTVKAGENVVKVIVTNSFGCKNEASTTIFGIPKLDVPNAFSPNSDNVNDFFNIVSRLEGYFKTQKFEVYSRLGKLVYNNQTPERGWDGRYNGNECTSDVYIYVIEVSSKSGTVFRFNGEVTLMR